MFAYLSRRGTRPRTTPRGCAGSPRPWPRSPAPAGLGGRHPGRLGGVTIIPDDSRDQAPASSAVPAGGMPGWQITLIAVAAALVTATAAVLLDRTRASRRSASATG